MIQRTSKPPTKAHRQSRKSCIYRLGAGEMSDSHIPTINTFAQANDPASSYIQLPMGSGYGSSV